MDRNLGYSEYVSHAIHGAIDEIIVCQTQTHTPNQINYQESDRKYLLASEQDENEANDSLSTRTPISFMYRPVGCDPIFLQLLSENMKP